MKLYGYWRSSAAYRVRIALHLKGIECESIPVHLIKDGGEQHQASYRELNPNQLVPTLVDDGLVLNQSLAIIDYLESKVATPSVYADDPYQRAQILAFALDIACEIHPINNLRVQQYLVGECKFDINQKSAWLNHWMSTGFAAIEQKLRLTAGTYCFGEKITLADICLIPQIYNAHRFGIDMSEYPLINHVVDNCNLHPAFIAALPENQSDAVK